MKYFNNKHFLVLIALVTICFAACKKNQVCTCNVTAIGYAETLNYTFTETNKQAKDACDTYEKNAASNIANSGFSAVNADCTLK
jgi:hypothetical protein